MQVLGIETSCDETGIAIYDSNHGLRAHVLYSQVPTHIPYGGVVPELASRDHSRKILPLLAQTLTEAGITKTQLDGIAYTAGPGLVGALMVGACVSRSLGYALQIPTIGVHHLEGHLLAPLLEDNPPAFPFLALLVSGGHTSLIAVAALGRYQILGESVDDAAGEAFDKTAKLLGLPYPGGAPLSQLATQGHKGRFHFPRPMTDRPGLNFSFSGLKTAVMQTVRTAGDDPQTKANIAFAFQEAIVDTLVIKCRRALEQTGLKQLVVSGGVSANTALRQGLNQMTEALAATTYYPRLEFCTDNGAMIAYLGCQRLLAGQRDDLRIMAKPRWSMEELELG